MNCLLDLIFPGASSWSDVSFFKRVRSEGENALLTAGGSKFCEICDESFTVFDRWKTCADCCRAVCGGCSTCRRFLRRSRTSPARRLCVLCITSMSQDREMDAFDDLLSPPYTSTGGAANLPGSNGSQTVNVVLHSPVGRESERDRGGGDGAGKGNAGRQLQVNWIRLVQDLLHFKFLTKEVVEGYRTWLQEYLVASIQQVEGIDEVEDCKVTMRSIGSEAPQVKLVKYKSNEDMLWAVRWAPQSWGCELAVSGKKLGVKFRVVLIVGGFSVTGKLGATLKRDLSALWVWFSEPPSISFDVTSKATWGVVPLPLETTLRAWLYAQVQQSIASYALLPKKYFVALVEGAVEDGGDVIGMFPADAGIRPSTESPAAGLDVETVMDFPRLNRILSTQSEDGGFPLESKFVTDTLQVDFLAAERRLPVPINDAPHVVRAGKRLWATALAFTVLQKHFMPLQQHWEDSGRRACNFIALTMEELAISSDLLQEASDFLDTCVLSLASCREDYEAGSETRPFVSKTGGRRKTSDATKSLKASFQEDLGKAGAQAARFGGVMKKAVSQIIPR
eukprot:Rmarinus@m.26949